MFLAFEETEQSKIFENAALGYWKVTVERPLRLTVSLSVEYREQFQAACRDAKEEPMASVVERVAGTLGTGPHLNFNIFMDAIEDDAKEHGVKLTNKRKKLLQTALARRDENAEPVVKKIHKRGKVKVDPIRGRYASPVGDRSLVLEYEPDSDLRDTEQIPLLEEGGIEAFLKREVLPHAADAWYEADTVKTGYEISFTRYFCKPQPMRSLDEIRADILALENETEGLIGEIVGESAR